MRDKALSLAEKKKKLILQGDTLRLQLAVDLLQSKQSLKPLNVVKKLVRSPKILTLMGSFLVKNKKKSRMFIVLAVANLLLWTRKR